MGIKWKSVKFSTKKFPVTIVPFWAIQLQIALKKSKKVKKISFLHFSQKIIISKYKRHGYQKKERKILYKKVPSDHCAILSHSAANHPKSSKLVFPIFLISFFCDNPFHLDKWSTYVTSSICDKSTYNVQSLKIISSFEMKGGYKRKNTIVRKGPLSHLYCCCKKEDTRMKGPAAKRRIQVNLKKIDSFELKGRFFCSQKAFTIYIKIILNIVFALFAVNFD